MKLKCRLGVNSCGDTWALHLCLRHSTLKTLSRVSGEGSEKSTDCVNGQACVVESTQGEDVLLRAGSLMLTPSMVGAVEGSRVSPAFE